MTGVSVVTANGSGMPIFVTTSGSRYLHVLIHLHLLEDNAFTHAGASERVRLHVRYRVTLVVLLAAPSLVTAVNLELATRANTTRLALSHLGWTAEEGKAVARAVMRLRAAEPQVCPPSVWALLAATVPLYCTLYCTLLLRKNADIENSAETPFLLLLCCCDLSLSSAAACS